MERNASLKKEGTDGTYGNINSITTGFPSGI